MSRIVLVDAALERRLRGHHQQLVLGYLEPIGAHRCVVAGHRSITGLPALRSVRTIGAFAHSTYDLGEHARLGRIGRLIQTAIHTDRFGLPASLRMQLKAAARVRRLGDASRRQSAVSSATPSPLVSELRDLIAGLELKDNDHLVFLSLDRLMCEAIAQVDRETSSGILVPTVHLRCVLDHDACVDVVDALGKSSFGRRIFLYGETPLQAQQLAQRLSVPVEVAPYPAISLPRLQSPAGRILTVGYFGEARAEKGFHLLEPIVRSFRRRWPDLADRVRWRFQAGGASPEATEARDRVRRASSHDLGDLTYEFGVLSPAAYRQKWINTDIVLAPQNPQVYAVRGSGVAHEAAAGGRPLICIEGSSLGGIGAVATGRDVDDLADAIAAVVAAPAPWFSRAGRAAIEAAEAFRASPLISRLGGNS